MWTIDQFSEASLADLNTELAAAGHPSDHQDVYTARWAVAHLLAECGGLDLHDYDTADRIGPATAQQILESALSGPEGVIDVDGRTCYVA